MTLEWQIKEGSKIQIINTPSSSSFIMLVQMFIGSFSRNLVNSTSMFPVKKLLFGSKSHVDEIRLQLETSSIFYFTTLQNV